jgi:hypothetical protein
MRVLKRSRKLTEEGRGAVKWGFYAMQESEQTSY